MDDWALKCNINTCRKAVSLDGKAVVTTCSHVFCLGCANSHACLTQGNPYPICPACETQLTEADDVVCNSLQPSADYKSSVLSGLPPSVVLEVASRALNFWAYQQQMESTYQQMVLKQAQDRLSIAERDRNNMESQAMNEIRNTEAELAHERSKVHEAAETHKINRKQYEKLKSHFDKLRSRSLLQSSGLPADPNHMAPPPVPVANLVEPFNKATPVRGAPQTRPQVGRTFGGPQTGPNGLQAPGPGHRHVAQTGEGFITATHLQEQQRPSTSFGQHSYGHFESAHLPPAFNGRGGGSSHSGGSGGHRTRGFVDPTRVNTPQIFDAGSVSGRLESGGAATPITGHAMHQHQHRRGGSSLGQHQHPPRASTATNFAHPQQPASMLNQRHQLHRPGTATPRPNTATGGPTIRTRGFRPSTAAGL